MKYRLSFLVAMGFGLVMFMSAIFNNKHIVDFAFIGVLLFMDVSLMEAIVDAVNGRSTHHG